MALFMSNTNKIDSPGKNPYATEDVFLLSTFVFMLNIVRTKISADKAIHTKTSTKGMKVMLKPKNLIRNNIPLITDNIIIKIYKELLKIFFLLTIT